MLLENEFLCVFPQGPSASPPGHNSGTTGSGTVLQSQLHCSFVLFILCFRIKYIAFNGTRDLSGAQGVTWGSLGHFTGSLGPEGAQRQP